MIPSPWVGVVLALAAYRLSRLVGWDDFPPVQRVRDWLTGADVRLVGDSNTLSGLTAAKPTEVVTFRRPLLDHFLHCAFCAGFWVCVAVYGLWVGVGGPGALHGRSWVFYALSPFALNGAVGLIARNLDP